MPLTEAGDNPYRRSLLRRENSRDTRRRLIRSAVQIWSGKAYEDSTVAEICRVAGVSRATFYFHFSAKDELLNELGFSTARGVREDVARAGDDLVDQLHTYIDGVARRMETVPKNLAALVLRNAFDKMLTPSASSGTEAKNTVEHEVYFHDVLKEILGEAQRARVIATDLDINELSLIIEGVTMEALQRWVTQQGTGLSLSESLKYRIDLILRGLYEQNSVGSRSRRGTRSRASR